MVSLNQFKPAYLSGLAQFVSRNWLSLTPGYRIESDARAFVAYGPKRRFSVSRTAREYRITTP